MSIQDRLNKFYNDGENMSREKLLSVMDIAQELNTGKATVKFLLKRFKKWMPFDFINGQPFYPGETIKKLFMIQENLEMGMLPSDIEKKLDALCHSDSGSLLDSFENPSQNEDIRLSNDGLALLRSLFHDIGDQQKRIAAAHEKRAEAEERKAVAIEKRAEAEEKKAQAMNNIANALQEMNALRGSDPSIRQVAHQAATIIASDETSKEGALSDAPLDNMNQDLQMDDLSLLIEKEKEIECTEDPSIDLDDLSELIDEDPLKSAESAPLDDLSLLLDTIPAADDTQIELDDLSKLIDAPSDSGQETRDLDDLSLLIEKETSDSIQMDDLSRLIDDSNTVEDPEPDESKPEDTPALSIDISPEDDLEKYKAAVMKIIIELKADGLSFEETTSRLNKNKIKTLSGKPEWNPKAISQIYKFIESAK
jgi:hypothetical protein